jgi:hypothetical protein
MSESVLSGVQGLEADLRARAEYNAARGLWACLTVCAVVYFGVAAIFLSTHGFWSPDSAVRLVQVESLARYGLHGVAISYPAATIDPQGRYFPFGPWFHFVRDGRFYVSYPPYFPTLVAPLYRALGNAGLVLLPSLAGLGTVWVTYRVLRRHAPELAMAGTLAVGLATPLVIYSTVFWDHTPVVLLSSAALGLVARACATGRGYRSSDLLFAGVLLSLGLWIRNEMYVLIPAVLASWMCCGPQGRLRGALTLVAGLVVPVGALWVLNHYLTGSLLGWKAEGLAASRATGVMETVTGHASGTWLLDRFGNVYYQLISPDYYAFNLPAVIGGVLLAAGFGSAALLLRIGVSRRQEWPILVAGLLSAAIGVFIILRRTDVSGLLPATPCLLLAFLPGPITRWERFLWAVVFLFTVGIIVTGTHGGLQWGPRYLLPIVPPLVWLAAAAVERAQKTAPAIWTSLRFTAVALVSVSLLIQTSGVDQVSQVTATNARVNQALRAAPAEIVVTPLEWVMLGAGSIYFDKSLMYVAQPGDFRVLVERLSAERVTRWTYIPLSGVFFSPKVVATWTGRSYRFEVSDDRVSGGLRFITFAGSLAPSANPETRIH